LHRRAFERSARLLDRFQTVAEQFGVIKAAVVCTSAVREAVNRKSFVDSLREAANYPVRVLSARQEATLSALGALIGLRPSERSTAVVDIGGGSTEVISQDRGLTRFWLAPWGAARATEAWKRISAQPPDQRVKSLTQAAAIILRDIPTPDCQSYRVVGVGGTIVTLAMIHAGLSEFDPHRLHGTSLPTSWVVGTAKRLAGMNAEGIVRLIPFDPDRARVLAAGTILWAGVLNRLAADRVVVSVRGLRWGVAVRLAEGHRI